MSALFSMSACVQTSPTKANIREWIIHTAKQLGFADVGFLSVHHPVFQEQLTALRAWLDEGLEGQLKFLHDNHHLRAHPHLLVEGAKTIISVRMDYLVDKPKSRSIADNDRPNHAIIARYARGRDYHKTMRAQLKKLAMQIEAMLPIWQDSQVGADIPFVFRPFSDSAPIFERGIAEHAQLGFTGKHTLLIHPKSGSFFVLGELFISLDLTDDSPAPPPRRLCGSCTACLDICPTKAILRPFTINAAACISYLTIEHDGAIPIEYRKAIGNRIFGCDDCQLICPWNKFAKLTTVADFAPRHHLDDIDLLDIWAWDEATFLNCTEGSPLRRTGYHNLLRNVAIALGNALAYASNTKNTAQCDTIVAALQRRLGESALVDEHIHWALAQRNSQT